MNACPNRTVMEWLQYWGGLCPRVSSTRAWATLCFAVVMSIWEAWNELVFKDKEAVLEEAIDSVRFRVASWFKYYGRGSNEDLTILFLDVNGRCIDRMVRKRSATTI